MKKIAIWTNERGDRLPVTREVISVLRTFCEKIYVQDPCGALAIEGVKTYGEDRFPKEAEMLLVLGGDGTMLRAAQTALRHDVPLMGINMGRLGYLASVERSEISLLSALASDAFVEKQHMILEVSLSAREGETPLGYALNDVVVDGGGHLADIRLYDGDSYLDYRADGLIVATPTGSTAYSFSAGGPVMDEGMDAICVTPVCPRSFFSRSLLFSSESSLTVQNRSERIENLDISIDGHIHFSLMEGSSIVVRRAEKRVCILSLKERNLLEVLCTKMDTHHF